MKLIIVRHFPTKWNIKGLLQGKRDISVIDVCAQEIAEIRSLLHELLEEEPDIILVSSLSRTQQSAKILGFNDYQIEPELDELDFGEFEGLSKDELINRYGDNWSVSPGDMVLGEPVIKLKDRIRKILDKYSDKKVILCFGHGAWMRAFNSYIRHDGDINHMNQEFIPNLSALRMVKLDDGSHEISTHTINNPGLS